MKSLIAVALNAGNVFLHIVIHQPQFWCVKHHSIKTVSIENVFPLRVPP